MTEDPVGGTPPPSSSEAAATSSDVTDAPSDAGGATLVKADLGKRFVAAIIDAVIAVVVGFIPLVGGLAATAYWLVRDGIELDFMDRRSIGKRLVKIRPVRLDGAPMDLTTSMKRNWMFALGGIAQLLAFTIIGLVLAIPLGVVAFVIGIVEIVLVVVDANGRRLGDKLAVTQVVESET